MLGFFEVNVFFLSLPKFFKYLLIDFINLNLYQYERRNAEPQTYKGFLLFQ